jgi:hypothetical protein
VSLISKANGWHLFIHFVLLGRIVNRTLAPFSVISDGGTPWERQREQTLGGFEATLASFPISEIYWGNFDCLDGFVCFVFWHRWADCSSTFGWQCFKDLNFI